MNNQDETNDQLAEDLASLRRRVSELEAEAATNDNELLTLLKGLRALPDSADLSQTARAVFDLCKHLLGATAGYVALRNSDETPDEVLFLDSGGRSCQIDPSLSMPRLGLRAKACHSGKTIYVNSFSNSEWQPSMPAGHMALDNVLFAPLMLDRKAVGILGLANKPGGFNDHDARMAGAFGEMAAVALRNSRNLQALQDSEEWHRGLIETAQEGIWVIDRGSKISFVNTKMTEMLGYALDEMKGKSLFDFMDEEAKAEAEQYLERRRQGVREEHDFRFRRRDGSDLWARLATNPILDKAGNYSGALAMVADITDRKRMERVLLRRIEESLAETPKAAHDIGMEDIPTLVHRETHQVELELQNEELRSTWLRLEQSRDKYQDLYDFAPIGYVTMDKDAVIVEASVASSELLGVAKQSLVKMKLTHFVAPESQDVFYACRRTLIKTLVRQNCELAMFKEDGTPFYVRLTIAASPQPDGNMNRCRAALIDITERKRVEEALAASEERYRVIVETANEAIWLLDENMIISYVNPKMAQMLGYAPEQIVGESPLTFMDAEWQKSSLEYLEQRRKGVSDRHEGRLQRKDGTRIDILVSATPLLDTSGRYKGQVSIYLDITERKRAEEAIQESENRFRTVFENSPTGISIARDGITLLVNQACLRLFGYDAVSELEGTSWLDRIAPHCRDEMAERSGLMGQGKHISSGLETAGLKKDGSLLPLYAEVADIEFPEGKAQAVFFTDITQVKEAEEETKRNLEKLASALEKTIHVAASVIEKKDPYTAGHQRRAADLAFAIATEMGLPEPHAYGIKLAGIVHDIGKIAAPGEILTAPRHLTSAEFGLIRTHPEVGYDILRGLDLPWPIAKMVLQHHELVDGSGYPAGLRGEDILLEARILTVADVVEAMSSYRPYRPARGIDKALCHIEQNKGTLYDPDVVDACLRLFTEKGFKLEEEFSQLPG